MIYRIHHNESYLMHVVPPVESMNTLGEQYGTFAFNAEPIPYQQVWKPLTIEFRACEETRAKDIPDVSENFGRLFLSDNAYHALKELLEPCGECLPVTFDSEQGYLFNPLLTAEQYKALDDKLTRYDEYGNLVHFRFVEDKLKDACIFKTKLDTFKGIFCLETFKEAYEKAGLTGIHFHPDVANPIGDTHGTTQ